MIKLTKIPESCPLKYRIKVEIPIICPCYNKEDCNSYVLCDYDNCPYEDICNRNAKECDVLNE